MSVETRVRITRKPSSPASLRSLFSILTCSPSILSIHINSNVMHNGQRNSPIILCFETKTVSCNLSVFYNVFKSLFFKYIPRCLA